MIPISDLVGLAHARKQHRANPIFTAAVGRYNGVELHDGPPLTHDDELRILRESWVAVQELKARYEAQGGGNRRG